ncbi:MAG: YdbL family protein [Kiloniellaceae bacterium]
MTRRWFSLLSLVMALGLALPLLAGPAAAQSLDDLRAAGKIGERYDGFAVARDPNLADKVKEVNDKRRAIYKEQAAKQGVPLEQVGLVYANEILQQVPSGTWVLTVDGEWRQK